MNSLESQPAPARGSLSGTVILSALVAALGGLLFGYDTAVISGTTGRLREVFGLNESYLGFTVAVALIGTVVGSIIFGRPADIWGRKKVLIVLAVLYLVTSLGTALAWDWYSFLIFRFLGGLSVGGASVVSPLYIAEISPAKSRGRLVVIQQFNIVFGIMLAQLVNYFIAGYDLGADEWRWMLGVMAIPSLAFLVLLFPLLESPRWLIKQGRIEEARQALLRLGSDGEGVDQEVDEILASVGPSEQKKGTSLFQPAYRVPVMLAIAIAMFNQLSGINAVLYYAPEIFSHAGNNVNTSLLQAAAIGLTNMVFTMLAMLVIDRAGRRALMIVGSIGYIIGLSATAWAFYTYGTEFTSFGNAVVLGGLLVFIAAHGFGQGAVIWVFISEIFPNLVRAEGQSLGSTTHWLMNVVISWTFPIFVQSIGSGNTFAFYAVMMVIQLLWVLFIMPETKGVPLEEMEKKLGIG